MTKLKKSVRKTPSRRKILTKKARAVSVKTKQRAQPRSAKQIDGGPQVSVVGVNGKVSGRVRLPHTLFSAKINTILLAQAVRVFLANQRAGTASTKTRAEVEGSTRKIYRQKGTGRARHGGIRAPIFVGGGVVFGPKPRDYSLSFPKKMRRGALAAALTSKLADGAITVVDGLDTLEPKTRVLAKTFSTLGVTKPLLLVLAGEARGVVRATRNIEGVDLLPASNLNAYAVLSHKSVLFMKEAVEGLRETFTDSKGKRLKAEIQN